MVNGFPLIHVPEIKDDIGDTGSYRDARYKRFKATSLTTAFNRQINKTVHMSRKAFPSANIVLFHFPSFFRTVKKNTKAFGFSTIDEGCLLLDIATIQYSPTDSCELATDIDAFFFFDQLHFSGEAHQYFGRSLFSQLPR